MHGNGGGLLLLALLLIGPPGFFAGRAVLRRSRGSQGQPRAGGGIVTGWLAHRRALRLKRVDHENASARDKARHEHRLREQEARAQRARDRERGGKTVPGETIPDGAPEGTQPDAGDGHGFRAPRRTVDGRAVYSIFDDLRTPPWRWGRRGPDPAATPEPHGRERAGPAPVSTPEPPARGGGSPAQPGRPAPGPDPIPTVKGTIVTTPAVTPEAVPGAEMVIEGLRRIYAHAMAGNIQAKRRAVLALAEVARRAAVTAMTLARSMAEPGQHYGTAVTERLGRMAAIFTAAHSAGTEVDSELRVILNTTPGEAMAAGRPMPHHDEFAESGSR